jgi:hypothetical protein
MHQRLLVIYFSETITYVFQSINNHHQVANFANKKRLMYFLSTVFHRIWRLDPFPERLFLCLCVCVSTCMHVCVCTCIYPVFIVLCVKIWPVILKMIFLMLLLYVYCFYVPLWYEMHNFGVLCSTCVVYRNLNAF